MFHEHAKEMIQKLSDLLFWPIVYNGQYLWSRVYFPHFICRCRCCLNLFQRTQLNIDKTVQFTGSQCYDR